MRLILVRHPKPVCEPGLCYGRLDLACDAHALDQAVPRLAALAQGCHVFTSPARRALSLASRLNGAPVLEPRLHELDFGDWEGHRWSDLGRETLEAWQRGLPYSAPPNGETLAALAARCADWLAEFQSGAPPALAVTHAGPIRVIRALVEGEPLLTYFESGLPFAEPVTLEVDQYLRD